MKKAALVALSIVPVLACSVYELDPNRGGLGSGGTVAGSGGSSVTLVLDAALADGAMGGPGRDPVACEEAARFRTYLGCEYFPTVLGNVVSPDFDFAVIVANPSDEVADVHVDGPNGFHTDATAAAHGIATLYLPWVSELKGPSLGGASCSAAQFTGSVLARGGAYRLTTTRPVAAYQFSPLEFRAAGGPLGKAWTCQPATSPLCQCNSYSNDASLLLPANALTSNYIASTWRDQGNPMVSKPSYIAVTGVEDDTQVTVKVSAAGRIQAGPAGSLIPAANSNDVIDFMLNRGDVVELMAAPGTDLSGTLIQAASKKAVQVMTGSPSATVPNDSVHSADHIEEIVFPAEVLGRNYVVTVPTGPHSTPVRHVVRLYGHGSATMLSYFPEKPQAAPTSLMPLQVAEFETTQDFQVKGTMPFAVGTFLVGGQLLDPAAPPNNSAGDPSQSFVTALPQYRDKYVFLAPLDYESNFVDIVAPQGTMVKLDGSVLEASSAAMLGGKSDDGTTDISFDIYRKKLDAGPLFVGSHEILASAPVGIQVVGYGRFTSYQYPGGLNLNLISEAPVTIVR